MTKKQKKMLIRIILSTVLTAIAWIVTELFKINKLLLAVIYVIPFVIIGYDVIKSAVINIFHGQVFDEKFLMFVATVGAFGIGEYREATAVMLFYQVGELFQGIAVGRSRKSIASLMDIRPDYAIVIREGVEVKVSPEEVKIGEIIVVKPGEKIPIDGVIVEGRTSINTSALTGESMPSDKDIGENVISGSINISSVIKVKAESVYAESTVAKILELVENASSKKAKVENFITRFARIYTPCVVIAAVLLAVIPPLVITIFSIQSVVTAGQLWLTWLNRALVFLVVSCPCALVVSVPLSFFGGIGGASRHGILIKGSNYLERLSKIDTIAFDKTGTLTQGKFSVTNIHPETISKDLLIDIAAEAESYSNHPVAESIVRAHKGHIDKSRIGVVEEIAGKGIKAVVDGKTFYIGNTKLMDDVGAKWHDCESQGTMIHMAEGETYIGHIHICDEPKPNAKESLRELKKLGIKKTVMLTGDNEIAAKNVAEQLQIDEFYAALLPAQKVEKVEELINLGCVLGFAGDGINDAPVLSRADVGIAMGAMGSDAAIESADIVLMDDKLENLATAIKVSRKTMNIVHQNICLALGVKGIILLLGAFGFAGMWFAVFGDVGVLIIAVLNSMRAMIKVNK